MAKDNRLSLRIDGDLKRRMEQYVERHKKSCRSLSALTTKFYEELLRNEEEAIRKKATSKFF